MRQTICALVLAIFCLATNAQIFEWAKNIGSLVQDEGHDVAVDASGNVYTTGTFRYTTDFDPDEDEEFYLTNNEASDVFVQKLNPDGELIWAISVGSDSFDNSRAISTDADGFVYVVGNFLGTADFDPDTTVTFNLISAGIDDAFVVKLTTDGDLVWAKQLGGPSTDEAYDVVVDDDGNAYITGRFQDMADFDPGANTSTLTASGMSDDIFVCKLDASGELEWAKSVGGGGNDFGLSVALDNSGNVITTGYFWGVVDFDPGANVTDLTSVGAMDIYIQKLDGEGSFIWAKQMGSTGYDLGYSVAVDANSDIYSTGRFEYEVDFDPNSGTQNFTSNGQQDIYINKLTSAGDYVWTKTMGSTLVEWGQSIALDGVGGVYATGFYQGTVDFNPDAGTADLTSAGFDDVFIVKLGVGGNYIWAQSMGGVGGDFDGDRGQALALDAEGNIYTTGWFFGTADFDPSAATENLTSNGNYDIFIQRISQPGNAVSEVKKDFEFGLYPNPSNGSSDIVLPAAHSSVLVQVTNELGQIIYSKTHFGTPRILLNLEQPKGIYFVQLTLENGQQASTKWVIE